MEVGLLTEVMNVFVDAFSGGFDRIRPAIGGLLRVLIGIEVAWFCLMFMLGTECLSGAFKKAMSIGIWIYVAQNFDQHALALVDSLVKGGLMAAGSEGQSARQLLNPSSIMDDGFTAVWPLGQQVLNGSLLSFAGTFPMYLLTYLLMLASYGMLAVSAFMVMIEYYLAIAVVGLLVPFGVLGPTRWIAMKPMSYFLSCGLKMMVISFLVAISRTALLRIRFSGPEPTLREMGIAVCCTGMIALLAWKGPDRLAQGFMLGSASFGGADVVRHAQSTVAVMAAPAVGALAAIKGAVGDRFASHGGLGASGRHGVASAAVSSMSANQSPHVHQANPPTLAEPPATPQKVPT